MSFLEKFKFLKPKKKDKKEAPKKIEGVEKKPKKSLLKRFYTTVFKKREDANSNKKISNQDYFLEPDEDDLILFYLLELSQEQTVSNKNMEPTTNKIKKIHDNTFLNTIMKELNNENIDIKTLSGLCLQGIPSNCQIIRPICWKVLLNYLPNQKNIWKQSLNLKRIQYENLVEKFFFSIKKKNSMMKYSSNLDDKERKSEKTEVNFMTCNSNEHPLSKEKTSHWNEFFTDQKLWDEIEKDIVRTKHGHPFFGEPNLNNEFYHYPNLSIKMRESTIDFETHYVTITRILFIYAKKNPEISYVQGMNEIIATLYYCFHNDKNPFFQKISEIDSYFCFEKIMEEVKENFIVGKDKKLIEMEHKTKTFSDYLKKTDLKLWEHLKKNNIAPEFYFNKWLISMLTQEFQLEDVLRLWDPLISSSSMINHGIFLCLGILVSMREQVLSSDFSGIMDLLQSTSKLEIDSILNIAHTVSKNIQDDKTQIMI